jgi:hypothetical protein
MQIRWLIAILTLDPVWHNKSTAARPAAYAMTTLE